ncbi:hypothetical protein F4775DRAFT_178328 [Biscogniauxia sp. FL1348]|nr:hypothetical protein F4775DRAFT_178328 [Biscogniauxia sp. FL1348]
MPVQSSNAIIGSLLFFRHWPCLGRPRPCLNHVCCPDRCTMIPRWSCPSTPDNRIIVVPVKYNPTPPYLFIEA